METVFETGGLENMLGFGKKNKTGEGITRREFMKGVAKTGIAAAGVYATAKGFGLGQEAQATGISRSTWENYSFPPGIAMGPDIAKEAYFLCDNPAYGDTGFATHLLSGNLHITGGVAATEIERLTQPAIYFIGGKYDLNLSVPKNLKEVNPALWEFLGGIYNYFGVWQRKRGNDKIIIEKQFINSIFLAAYQAPSQAYELANQFYSSDLSAKTQMANDVIKQFQQMKGDDKKSSDPLNPHYRKLIASWSAYCLSRHYERIEGVGGFQFKKEQALNYKAGIIAWEFEYPLKKILGYWIRANKEPYYGF